MHAQQGSSGLIPVGLPDTQPAKNSVSEDTCSAWAILLGHVTALSIFPSFRGMGSFVATSLFLCCWCKGSSIALHAADNYFRLWRYRMSFAKCHPYSLHHLWSQSIQVTLSHSTLSGSGPGPKFRPIPKITSVYQVSDPKSQRHQVRPQEHFLPPGHMSSQSYPIPCHWAPPNFFSMGK